MVSEPRWRPKVEKRSSNAVASRVGRLWQFKGMLPAKFRLKIKSGTRIGGRDKKELYTPYFKTIYRIGERSDPPKVGFIVSGKVGNATKRNRLRRLLSEAVRGRIEKLPNGFEGLVVSNQNTGDADYEKICACLDKVLSKISFASY